MYRCNKSIEVCNETTGELLCEERPVYGGTGKVVNPNMDEPGSIVCALFHGTRSDSLCSVPCYTL